MFERKYIVTTLEKDTAQLISYELIIKDIAESRCEVKIRSLTTPNAYLPRELVGDDYSMSWIFGGRIEISSSNPKQNFFLSNIVSMVQVNI